LTPLNAAEGRFGLFLSSWSAAASVFAAAIAMKASRTRGRGTLATVTAADGGSSRRL
jgi:hypothetical protein